MKIKIWYDAFISIPRDSGWKEEEKDNGWKEKLSLNTENPCAYTK